MLKHGFKGYSNSLSLMNMLVPQGCLNYTPQQKSSLRTRNESCAPWDPIRFAGIKCYYQFINIPGVLRILGSVSGCSTPLPTLPVYTFIAICEQTSDFLFFYCFLRHIFNKLIIVLMVLFPSKLEVVACLVCCHISSIQHTPRFI